jgi:protein-disulfide isomerase
MGRLRQVATVARAAADTAATLAVIAVSVTMVWFLLTNRSPRSVAGSQAMPNVERAAPLPTSPIALDDAQLQGDRTARVAVVEYSDFQCPYCGRFATTTLPEIRNRYIRTGKILWAFKHMPLEQLHPLALSAAEAADCAAEQGRFWPMHDYFFSHQDELDPNAAAKAINLDLDRFTSCLTRGDVARIRRSASAAGALGVTGTPSFFLGTLDKDGRLTAKIRLTGAIGADAFSRSIDELLKQLAANAS